MRMQAAPHKQDTLSERLPSEVEIKAASQLRKILANQIKEGQPTNLQLATDQGHVETITLAPALAASMLDLLRLVSSGRGFQMIPVDATLTTQQAADILNVSRPYLVKLLENGEIPFIKIGRHRRIEAQNLFNYKAKRDSARSKALDTLASADIEDELI